MRKSSLVLLSWLVAASACATVHAADDAGLSISWEMNYLTIRGARVPGDEIKVHYLEAYCRPGSTDADWVKHTMIGHKTELVAASTDGKRIELRCTLTDGVVVDHVITAAADEVDFRVVATNPTDKPSQAHWAQPCVRLDKFTGLETSSRTCRSASSSSTANSRDCRRSRGPWKLATCRARCMRRNMSTAMT